MSVVAMLPAHNEARTISSAVRSLRTQRVTFDRIVVVADNCTDTTVEEAQAAGADVFRTEGNTDKKAGALNQALAHVDLDDDDVLLVMDADTRLGADYMATVADRFGTDPDGRLGAVGGIFHGDSPRRLLPRLQASEYARYAREIGRRQGRVHVLTGTASAFRVRALRDVAAARGTRLPGRRGEVYDTGAITEDNEMTIALKTIGWRLVSPRECLVYTELMPTLRALHDQRLRWYRGALDNIRTYGITPVTRRYWWQQAGLLLSSVMLCAYLVLMTTTIVNGHFGFSWFWTGIGALFILERVVTVWRAGPQARVLAALLVPELLYDLWLQVAFFHAVGTLLRGSTPEWRHHRVTQPERI
ncbi:Glycosyl transferase (fragment) [Nostocoides japonicum T1-X7]|uniref:Glycosyl transferase n=2 Tax=Nostocoides japonicum TaxID=99481 RepID=A0A077LYL0_9MICO